ncbi:hypothetical protein [Microcoleus sp. B13-B6]|uniref:hypothetical protein n=1 Tax=Microcoleus sp. B13-B6 TaxID=2818652 RepID=UPI002FD01804
MISLISDQLGRLSLAVKRFLQECDRPLQNSHTKIAGISHKQSGEIKHRRTYKSRLLSLASAALSFGLAPSVCFTLL